MLPSCLFRLDLRLAALLGSTKGGSARHRAASLRRQMVLFWSWYQQSSHPRGLSALQPGMSHGRRHGAPQDPANYGASWSNSLFLVDASGLVGCRCQVSLGPRGRAPASAGHGSSAARLPCLRVPIQIHAPAWFLRGCASFLKARSAGLFRHRLCEMRQKIAGALTAGVSSGLDPFF